MERMFFCELDISDIEGATVIADVDGTLCPDGADTIDRETAQTLAALNARNAVYCVSNSPERARIERLADRYGITMIRTRHRKPAKRILEAIPPQHRKNLVVIGDKFLTDGLFAKRIGARFIKVKRLRGKSERWTVALAYLADDIASTIFNRFPPPQE